MKTRSVLLSLFCLITFAVAAQGIETDDMYFNSKDRAKLKAQEEKELTYASTNNYNTRNADASKHYSARNMNPEYSSRKNSQTAQTDNQDYYVNNYQYSNSANVGRYNNFNSSYNNWYNSTWYNPSWYGPAMYGWNSPYYSGGYYNNMMMDPFYSPYYGYSGYGYGYSPYGYGYGSGFGYGLGSGFGMSFGMGYYNNPYYSSFYGGGWGNSFWANSYYYPGNVVVINNNSGGRNVVQGSRPTRSGMSLYNNNSSFGSGSTRSNAAVLSGRGRDDGSGVASGSSGGRMATQNQSMNRGQSQSFSNQRQADYYNNSWRNQQMSGSPAHSSGGWNNGGGGTYRPATPSYNNSSFGGGRSGSSGFSAPSHSGGGFGGGGGGFSGGGGGGHSRGR